MVMVNEYFTEKEQKNALIFYTVYGCYTVTVDRLWTQQKSLGSYKINTLFAFKNLKVLHAKFSLLG